MSKTKKAVIITSAVIGVLVLIAGIVAGSCALFGKAVDNKFEFEQYDGSKGGDRIHFLSVGNSDAILLESEGRFALVDCGEDSDNPRGFKGLELEGHEDFVVDYLNEFCADENGQIYLDFIIGTHSHSDHLGGFDTVLSQDNVHLERAYLKRYYEDRIEDKEVKNWDNLEVYNQTVDAINAQGAELIQDLENVSFDFGNYKITLYNGKEPEEGKKVGENENSLAILVEKDGYRVMLSGDMNNLDGDEKRVGKEVGKVDVLKIGHHGNWGSSSYAYINALKPDVAIQTGGSFVSVSVQVAVTMINHAPIYSTVKHNGIIIDVTDVKDVKLIDNVEIK